MRTLYGKYEFQDILARYIQGVGEVCRLRGLPRTSIRLFDLISSYKKYTLYYFFHSFAAFNCFVSVCLAAELILAEHVEDDEAEEGEDQER